ncbi:hypothetical protein EVAR_41578_1 [Eumeta japonica]|uniref:Uncharacterized protein n=1 Tax=Eumeta variegata TaxID=151549 RepID=A0A4C1Y022_EUMVA|nr:hypothetical protein EVAR_41578_1 [Eumeta japonica]
MKTICDEHDSISNIILGVDSNEGQEHMSSKKLTRELGTLAEKCPPQKGSSVSVTAELKTGPLLTVGWRDKIIHKIISACGTTISDKLVHLHEKGGVRYLSILSLFNSLDRFVVEGQIRGSALGCMVHVAGKRLDVISFNKDVDIIENLLAQYKNLLIEIDKNDGHNDPGVNSSRASELTHSQFFCKQNGFPETNKDFVVKKIRLLKGSFRKELKKAVESQRTGTGADEFYVPTQQRLAKIWFRNTRKEHQDPYNAKKKIDYKSTEKVVRYDKNHIHGKGCSLHTQHKKLMNIINPLQRIQFMI